MSGWLEKKRHYHRHYWSSPAVYPKNQEANIYDISLTVVGITNGTLIEFEACSMLEGMATRYCKFGQQLKI